MKFGDAVETADVRALRPVPGLAINFLLIGRLGSEWVVIARVALRLPVGMRDMDARTRCSNSLTSAALDRRSHCGTSAASCPMCLLNMSEKWLWSENRTLATSASLICEWATR